MVASNTEPCACGGECPAQLQACPECGRPMRALGVLWTCEGCGGVQVRCPEITERQLAGLLWGQAAIEAGGEVEGHRRLWKAAALVGWGLIAATVAAWGAAVFFPR